MLFWLKKALTTPFLPLYFTLLAGLVGTFLLWSSRHVRLGRSLVVAALLVLALASNREVSYRLLRSFEAQFPAIPEAGAADALPPELRACVAVVVLGAGHSDTPGMSRVNQLSTAGISRIAEAVRISRLLPAAKFVVSGHHIEGLSHAQVLGEAAVSLGVAPERIVRMDDPRDTEDEINELSRRFGQQPIAIVTSAWHLPRTIQLCRAAGVNAIPCPADFVCRPEPTSLNTLLGWDLESLGRSTKAIHESLGSIWLVLRGK